jgi:hypothetical protein
MLEQAVLHIIPKKVRINIHYDAETKSSFQIIIIHCKRYHQRFNRSLDIVENGQKIAFPKDFILHVCTQPHCDIPDDTVTGSLSYISSHETDFQSYPQSLIGCLKVTKNDYDDIFKLMETCRHKIRITMTFKHDPSKQVIKAIREEFSTEWNVNESSGIFVSEYSFRALLNQNSKLKKG